MWSIGKMLMRNFEISSFNDSKRLNYVEDNVAFEEKVDKSECLCDSISTECYTEKSERLNLQSCLGDLSSEALNYNYIQRLESELCAAKKELHAGKQENMQITPTLIF